jgi:hypothetical protein
MSDTSYEGTLPEHKILVQRTNDQVLVIVPLELGTYIGQILDMYQKGPASKEAKEQLKELVVQLTGEHRESTEMKWITATTEGTWISKEVLRFYVNKVFNRSGMYEVDEHVEQIWSELGPNRGD